MNMLGDWAVMANVKLAATVNTKLTISNQKAVRSERKLALQKSKIFCKSCTYACRCDRFNTSMQGSTRWYDIIGLVVTIGQLFDTCNNHELIIVFGCHVFIYTHQAHE